MVKKRPFGTSAAPGNAQVAVSVGASPHIGGDRHRDRT
ncbi:MAG: hypothetical protein QOG97_3509, partial [Acidimicrobiaceae bacterium]|nr:hypothetical protein [Acidimicrobiaceae bacterium]